MVVGPQFKFKCSISFISKFKSKFKFFKKKRVLFLNCKDLKKYCTYYKKDFIFINLKEINIYVLTKSLIQFIFIKKKISKNCT